MARQARKLIRTSKRLATIDGQTAARRPIPARDRAPAPPRPPAGAPPAPSVIAASAFAAHVPPALGRGHGPGRRSQLADCTAWLEAHVRTGFLDRETALASWEQRAPAWPAIGRADVEDVVLDLLARERARQRRWPKEGDNGRLDAAFAELEAEGVVARQRFRCCVQHGLDAIGAELYAARAAGRPVIGFVFFHADDAAIAAAGEPLRLAYGAEDDGDASGIAIGRRVIEALERHGLETSWDGSFSKRILVLMQWRRRLQGPARDQR